MSTTKQDRKLGICFACGTIFCMRCAQSPNVCEACSEAEKAESWMEPFGSEIVYMERDGNVP